MSEVYAIMMCEVQTKLIIILAHIIYLTINSELAATSLNNYRMIHFNTKNILLLL